MPTESSTHRPTVRLASGDKRARLGHPWVYSNEVAMDPATKALRPGTIVDVVGADGRGIATAFFNPKSLIAVRVLAPRTGVPIDRGFVAARIDRALALRETLFVVPHYRLVHAEADGLPGLIVDRFGDVFVVQANTAGAEGLMPMLLDVLAERFAPRAVVGRNDSPVRELEGLPRDTSVLAGTLDGPIELIENGVRYLADPTGGQKTGWFFDQRDNRAFMASLAKGRRVIDFYTYAGGFALACAKAGAEHVTAVDRSEGSLAIAAKAAELNGLAERVTFTRAEVFGEMERLAEARQRFGVVIADPPPFVRSRADLATGAKGYRKMARLAASLVEPGGFLLCASCSHNIEPARFHEEIARGIHSADRSGRIIRSAGAGPDHPVHPELPESAYLKALVLQLD
ncbi:MAG: class I SAM-dependent rRNA methyltransferase [Gemmatimonas sp.]